MIYRAQDPAGRVDLWYLERSTPSDSEWTPRPFLNTPAIEVYARLSPNGRYAAYVSDESGRREVYVQPFPAGGPRTIVSTQGGGAPVWSADGKELFYVTPDNELMAASVTTEGEFKLGASARLFKRSNLSGTTTSTANYDIARDGRRFIAVEPADLNAQTAKCLTSSRHRPELAREVRARAVTGRPLNYLVRQIEGGLGHSWKTVGVHRRLGYSVTSTPA